MLHLTPVLLALAACGTATSTPASAPRSGYDLPALTRRVADRADPAFRSVRFDRGIEEGVDGMIDELRPLPENAA